MSNYAGDNVHSLRGIRVAVVTPSIAPYAIPEGERLASRPELITKHFFAKRKEPGRGWRITQVPFPHEIVGGFTISFKGFILYLPLALPIRLFKFKPDIILAGQLGTLSLFTYLYAIPARVPVLILWEGTPHTEARFSSGLRKRVRRLLVSFAAGFYCYTPAAERYLRDIGAKGPFFPEPASVDNGIFAPSNEPREANVLLFVGQLIPRKGADLLMRIFAEVVKFEPSCRLWIVGDGPLKPRLIESIPDRVRDRISWFGFLDQEHVASFYRRATVFVIPTLLDQGPIALLEAVTCGLPVVTTPFAGFAEILVRQGENGFLVDPRDTKSFARAVVDVLHSPNKQAMSEASQMLAKRHTPEQAARDFLTGIRQVLDGILP